VQIEPLISVGIPTYNRPEGLRKTLQGVTSQTYRNLEIIISDNDSKNDLVQEVVSDFQKNDNRIVFYKQNNGIGIVNNFMFVLENSTGEYFIWAADDDQWQGDDFLKKLMNHSKSNLLVFPDAVILNGEGKLEHPLNAYELCVNEVDYTRVFCSNGIGHPFYGLYNRKMLADLNFEFKFDGELSYYNEGTFLHKLFLAGPVKYVKEATILYSPSTGKTTTKIQLNDFYKYFNSVVLIYSLSNLPNEIKADLINEVFRNYVSHIKELTSILVAETENTRILPGQRLKKAIKVLLKGRL